MILKAIRHGTAALLSWLRLQYYRSMGTKIGKGCFISSHAYIDSRRGKISIGNNVSIAGGSYILSHTGFRPNAEGQETIIEDNVLIFVNSVILPGVRIGENSIIGAGSVVMRDVPPNVVVQGNPARVVQRLAGKPVSKDLPA
jgi:acetyltransferase-like isoleucine patch superfamily enzyme